LKSGIWGSFPKSTTGHLIVECEVVLFLTELFLLIPKSNQKPNLTYFDILKCNKIILGKKLRPLWDGRREYYSAMGTAMSFESKQTIQDAPTFKK